MGIVKTLGRLIVEHDNTILTVISLVGLAVTAYTSYKAAKDVSKDLEIAYEEKYKDEPEIDSEGTTGPSRGLTVEEKVKATWKDFLKPAVVGLMTAGCILANDKSHRKKYAALLALYQTAETFALDSERILKKTEEILGEEKMKEVRTAVAEEKVAQMSPSTTFYETGRGAIPFKDSISGIEFFSTVDTVKKAMHDYALEVANEGADISYNEFLSKLDIPEVESCKHIYYGVDGNGHVRTPDWADLVPAFMNDGYTPCTYISPRNRPLIGLK